MGHVCWISKTIDPLPTSLSPSGSPRSKRYQHLPPKYSLASARTNSRPSAYPLPHCYTQITLKSHDRSHPHVDIFATAQAAIPLALATPSTSSEVMVQKPVRIAIACSSPPTILLQQPRLASRDRILFSRKLKTLLRHLRYSTTSQVLLDNSIRHFIFLTTSQANQPFPHQ